MANTNYKYPRVTISTKALNHSVSVPEAVDTTILFAPICSPKGPTDKLVKLHTISELEDIFGRLDYEACGQTALNVYQWLSAGGTVYVKRLNNGAPATSLKKQSDEYVTDGKFEAIACGKWYNDLTLVITEKEKDNKKTGFFDITLKKDRTELLRSFSVAKKDVKKLIDNSGYIKTTTSFTDPETGEYKLGNGSDGDEFEGLLTGYLEYIDMSENDPAETKSIYADLGNRLETPVDIILDAGYPEAIKKLLISFLTGDAAEPDEVEEAAKSKGGRPDIIGIFDTVNSDDTFFSNTKARNIAVYAQKFTISDEILSDRDIEVSPTYFLARLLPYNDNLYGIQFPTAGLRRGVLEDVLKVTENPLPSKKESWFNSRINYVEKTSREYAFMSQRTHDGSDETEYTALSFLNNSRTLERMKKELERLGREYLFEFNDSVTLANMSNVLNKYIGQWIANRTLSYGLVEVAKNPYSDEAVDVRLNIRFNGTIEVISVDITIE